MDKICGVYKITSPTGKVYIGQSTHIYRRWTDYKYFRCITQSKIINSLRKHNYENHIFEIIEECEVEQLNNREGYWQDFYDSVNNGLNCQRVSTDATSGYLSQEHKDKISKAHKGKKLSKVTIDKIRKWNTGRKNTKEQRENQSLITSGDKNWNFGRDFSEEYRKNISMGQIERYKTQEHPQSKLVLDLETGVYYYNIKEAAVALGISYTTMKRWFLGTLKNKSSLIVV